LQTRKGTVRAQGARSGNAGSAAGSTAGRAAGSGASRRPAGKAENAALAPEGWRPECRMPQGWVQDGQRQQGDTSVAGANRNPAQPKWPQKARRPRKAAPTWASAQMCRGVSKAATGEANGPHDTSPNPHAAPDTGTTQWGLMATSAPITACNAQRGAQIAKLFADSRKHGRAGCRASARQNSFDGAAPPRSSFFLQPNPSGLGGSAAGRARPYGFTSGGTCPFSPAATFSAASITRSKFPPAIFSQSASE